MIEKARLYSRLEKVLITVESMLAGGFLGLCFSLTDESIWADRLGVWIAIVVFIVGSGYKRDIIRRERRKSEKR